MSDTAALRCIALTKVYRLASGPVTAIEDIDVEVLSRRVTVVAGPSGSGKSTLLRQLALVERPTRGHVELAGVDTSRLGRRGRRRLRADHVGYVFQRPTDNLVPDLPVREQVAMVAAWTRRPTPAGLLERFGLDHRADHDVGRLSGGEQQRLAFALAFAASPAVILADEPTAQLDAHNASAVIAALDELREAGATVVVGSHDEAVIEHADDIVRLRGGRVS